MSHKVQREPSLPYSQETGEKAVETDSVWIMGSPAGDSHALGMVLEGHQIYSKDVISAGIMPSEQNLLRHNNHGSIPCRKVFLGKGLHEILKFIIEVLVWFCLLTQ